MPPRLPMYLAGYWKENRHTLEVTNPYDGSLVGTTFLAQEKDLELAIDAAQTALPHLRDVPTYQRIAWLRDLANRLRAIRDVIVEIMVKESGKPLRDARVEFDRGIFVIDQAAEEAGRISGEVIPLDLMPSAAGRFGITRRYPIGLVAGVTPFNFPFNLAMHKVAPAIAAGCPIVLKPASATPLTMLAVAHELDKLGMPKGAASVLPMDRATGDRMVSDDRFALLSFTGSPDVGWDMKARAGKKKVVLELGGNAGVYIDDTADLELAIARIRVGGFGYAGQTCISVQRVFVHIGVYDDVRERLATAVQTLQPGDPLNENTELGPMIDRRAVERTLSWIRDAEREGARVVIGGQAEDNILQPTILERVAPSSTICSSEVFAPVILLMPVQNIDEGISAINDSRFGLQAGVFTNDLERALFAADRIDAGGVMINDVPSWRIDHMPYGGIKDSGLGREGLRYAIEDMTEPKLIVINRQRPQ